MVCIGLRDDKPWIDCRVMSKQPRRIIPPPNRGRKGEKKRKKQNPSTNHPNGRIDFGNLKQKFAEERRTLLLDESNDRDKRQLLEPSSLFFEKTEALRLKASENVTDAILLNDPIFKNGVDLEEVRTERERVLRGEIPSRLNGLPKELTEQRKILAQQQRTYSTNLLAKATQQHKQSQKNQANNRSDPSPDNQILSLSGKDTIATIGDGATSELVEQLEAELEALPEVAVDDSHEKTNPLILPDLRTQLLTEPQSEEFMIRVLGGEYEFNRKSTKTLIQHVASPFSVCKSMNRKSFQKLMCSLFSADFANAEDNDWGRLFEQLGHSTPNQDQLIEIRELLDASPQKNDLRCRLVALLYYFAPERFAAWWNHPAVPADVRTKMEADFNHYEQQDFPDAAIEHARMLVCAFAIEKPKDVATRYNYARHQSGGAHESKTEKWLKKGCPDVDYITEAEIKKGQHGRTYGGKRVHRKVTPDLLLSTPVKLTANGQLIHWIDAKKHFIDPSFSSDDSITQFCDQIKKYVDAYGPGLVVWGKDFSEEWNDATKGIVLHIRI